MLILSYKLGRLGNRIFAFAHLIAVARGHNLKVLNVSFDEYARFFKGTANDILCRYPRQTSVIKSDRLRSYLYVFNKAVLKLCRITGFFNSPLHNVMFADVPEYLFTETRSYDMNDPSFLKKAGTRWIFMLYGRFFRDYKHMEMYQDEIRSYFEPLDDIQMKIDACISEARIDADMLIGVHIRGEDYREFLDGKYFYDQRRYSDKLRELQTVFPGKRVRFVLCSNDEIDASLFTDLLISRGPGEVVADLYTLAKCDYILGAPSTFSLWAAFYGNKPLCQLWTIDTKMCMENFKMFPPEVLYNFAIN